MNHRVSIEAGISISDRAVRFVTLRGSRLGRLHPETYGEVPLPEGVISQGEIRDRTTLAAALAKLRSEQGFEFVSVALPEEKTYIYTTKIERVPAKDLHDVVAFTLEENVPLPLSNSVFYYKTFEEGEEYKAAVSVISKEVAEAYASLLAEAGFTPAAFDLEPEAVARALVAEDDPRPQFIIYLGERKTSLIAVEGGVIKFSSAHAIDLGSDPNSASALEAEVRKFLLFWKGKFDHMIVAGPMASEEALVGRVMAGIQVPYSLGNVWQNVAPLEKDLPQIPYSASLPYAAAIGSALPRLQEEVAKLLPENLGKMARQKALGRKMEGPLVYLGILLALAISFLGFLYYLGR